MRFPKKGGKIDQEKTTALVKAAVEGGINYFDAAYIYPGCEQALGVALADAGLRDGISIATKLPLHLCKTGADFDKYFATQLVRLKTDRIDYYLLHMLCDLESFERLKSLGLLQWIAGRKRDGTVINLGFSYHGGRDEFRKLIDAYDWDFCQIQYNYFDENNQAGRSGLKYASGRGMPVFVMEPLRGGLLVNSLPDDAKKVFFSADKNRTLADWALRWLWDQPEVTMALSGMSDYSQLSENLRLAGSIAPGSVSPREAAVYEAAVAALKKACKIPCTGCGYCLPCPHGVDIPTCFSCYNESFSGSFMRGLHHYVMNTGAISSMQTHASRCAKCRICEARCPQKIEISSRLSDVSRRMESFWFRPVFAAARKIIGVK